MFTMLLRRTVLLSVVLLSGCVTPLQKLEAPLTEADKADHVVILLAQSEIAVDDVDVQNLGGGLIGALVEIGMESTMTKNRQKAIAPLRDKLLDYQYQTKLVEAIQAHLPTSMVKADATFKVLNNDEELRLHLKAVAPANVFVLNTRYAMEQNFDIAYVYCSALLGTYTVAPPAPKVWKRMSSKQRKQYEPKVLHQGSYFSQHILFSPFAKQPKVKGLSAYERNAAMWAEQSAEPVRVAFAQALDEIASLIQRDGERTLPPTPERANVRAYLAHFALQPMNLKVKRIEQTDDRSLVVMGQNTHWIDNVQIKP